MTKICSQKQDYCYLLIFLNFLLPWKSSNGDGINFRTFVTILPESFNKLRCIDDNHCDGVGKCVDEDLMKISGGFHDDDDMITDGGFHDDGGLVMMTMMLVMMFMMIMTLMTIIVMALANVVMRIL